MDKKLPDQELGPLPWGLYPLAAAGPQSEPCPRPVGPTLPVSRGRGTQSPCSLTSLRNSIPILLPYFLRTLYTDHPAALLLQATQTVWLAFFSEGHSLQTHPCLISPRHTTRSPLALTLQWP